MSTPEVYPIFPDHRNQVQTYLSAGADVMVNANNRQFDDYTETEAAGMLGISIDRLHKLLDENVFNDGTPRPPELKLRSADIILLEFWNRGTENPKILRMPRRK